MGGSGLGAGVRMSSVAGSTGALDIGAGARVGARSDYAIADGDGVGTIVNDGTVTGYVTTGAGDDRFTNTSANSWDVRDFATSTDPTVRDTENVARSDFGAGFDTFTNTASGTVRLLTVEDRTGFTADATDNAAPTRWLTSGVAEYVPEMADPTYVSARRSIVEAGVEQAHLVNLEAFDNAGVLTMADAETGGAGPVAGDVFVITAKAAADGTAGAGTYISNGGQLHIDTVLNGGAVDDTDLLVVDGVRTGSGATSIRVTSARPGTGAGTDVNGNGVWDEGEGILIVQVLDAMRSASDAFSLAAPVVDNGIAYKLYFGSVGGDWFLANLLGPNDRGFCASGGFTISGAARVDEALGCSTNDTLTADGEATVNTIEGAGGTDTIAVLGAASVGVVRGAGAGQDNSADGDAGDVISIDTTGTVGAVYGGDDANIADGAAGDTIAWRNGAITTGIFGQNGSDILLVSAAQYDGRQMLDGGDDRSIADGMIDRLSLQSVTATAPGANLANWESVTLDNTSLTIADGAWAVGDPRVEGTGVELTTGSVLTGAGALVLAANLTLDPNAAFVGAGGGDGVFDLIGNVRNRGTISTADGAVGDVVRVTGDYAGGGELVLDADLDRRISDTLTIVGDVTAGSTTRVEIHDLGAGVGVYTGPDHGVRIVHIEGASASTAFALAQPTLKVGAFDYTLGQRPDGDFYLTSNYQSGVATLEALGPSLLEVSSLPTLQQRIGNRNWTASARPYRDDGALWGTLEGATGQRDPKLSTTRSKADVSHWKMRVGTDMGWSVGDKGDLVLGVFGHYGEGETKVHSALTDDGQIEQRTFGLGASLTWYAANGFYADGQLHYNHVSSRLYATKTGTTRLSKVNAGGLAGGLEAGYRIGRGRYAVIPQAQLSYSELGWDDFRLGTMSVADGEAKSLKGRLGLALSRQTVGENGKASHLYGVVNLHKAFEGKSAIWVSGTPVRSDPETLWGEIGAGLTHNLNHRTSLFAEGGYRAALSHGGDNYSLNGRIGFRMALGGGNHPHE